MMSRRGDRDEAEPATDPETSGAPDPKVSGDGEAVDHDRQPGVPPPSSDDYEDPVDIEGAESFPASDPPSGW
ncbi:MAG: hypothetical protein JWM86_1618 [Thermoleophilia bacterium]|nr:hypothetical protein [Thermoleophilia bacterium]